MYKIGITGSIGTGKTTIANLFTLFSIPIFDADKEIKKILNSAKIKRKLKDRWPDTINEDNINKFRLKSIIFSDKKEKDHLEKLLYPFLQVEKKKFEKKNNNKNILVYDVPLIYETKTQNNYDLILLAYCDSNLQKKRVLKRDQISNSLFDKIVKSQLSLKEKIKFKPTIINTNNIKLFIFFKIAVLLIKIQIMLKKQKWKKKES